jgi:ABC-type branched-subunit amino acid transport system substrate-binding protein
MPTTQEFTLSRRSRVLPALLLVLALLGAACGSDRESDADADADADGTSTTEASEATASGNFGTLESPCGEGDASGATDQGVTDDAIEIAYGDDAGYPAAPGLSQEAGDAVKAFIAWCNEQGGINGREVKGTYHDAKITEVNNVMTEACAEAFYLVGEYWVLDDGQEPKRRECGLPAVAAAAGTAKFANAPLKHEPVPSAIDRSSVYGASKLAEQFPDEIKTAGVLWGNYPVIIDRKDQVEEALTSLGYEFKPTCSVSYNIAGEADWKPLVQKLKNCGATWVYWVGSPIPNLQSVLEAADQLDYEPVWYSDTNTYDPSFAKWNTEGFADRMYFRMAYLPLEEADQEEAVQQYLDIVEADGGEVSQLGEQAASAFLLWATAAKACGSELTRDCVAEQLDDIHEWTGGGLHAPSDPGNNEPPTCGLMIRLDGTSFERVAPKEKGTYECDESYVYKVKPDSDLLLRNKIGADRIAQL